MSSDIIIVRQNKDLLLDNSIKIGSNIVAATPGFIRYNSTNDKFEGYLQNTQAYNNSNWAPMSLGIASPSELGGVKIGNNLTITGTGILSSVAGAPSRLFQRVLSVCQRPNTGDYESISECLSDFFDYQFTGSSVVDWTTSAGALKNEHDSDPVNFPWPDENNIYIIQVSPGVYNELTPGTTLNIPPYVALVGDLDNTVVIQNNTPNGVMIELSTGSILQNIVVDMSDCTQPTIGVLCNNYSSDITIKNVELRTDNLTVQKIGMDIRSNNVTISDCKSDITVATATSPVTTNKLILVKARSAQQLQINDCNFNVTGLRNTKSVMELIVDTTATINNTIINIQETNNNTTLEHINQAIYIEDSNAIFTDCQITVTGLDNKDDFGTNQLCRGIVVADTGIAPTITPNVGTTTFIHYNNFDDNDEIANPLYNWVTTGGLKIGDYIKPIAPVALNPENRGIFQIRGISSNGGYVLQLDNSASLTDQSIPAGVLQLKRLYNVALINSRVVAGSQTIYVSGAGNGENFRIQSAYTVLDGQNPEFNLANYILTVPQQITVGLQDCDFLSLADACDSITDSSAVKPYEVVVQPGYYIERRTVNIPSYVTVRGQGEEVTKIKFELADLGQTPYGATYNCAISIANDTNKLYAALADMSIEVPAGLNNNGSASELRGIYVPSIAGVSITNVGITVVVTSIAPVASNAKIYGIDISPASTYAGTTYRFKRVTVTMRCYNLGTTIYGMQFTDVNYSHLLDCTVSIDCLTSATGRNIYGISANRSKMDIVSPFITITADGALPAENGYGIFSTDSNLYPPVVPPTNDETYSDNPVLIFGGQIKVKGIPNDVSYSVFADYASTLFAMNTAVLGTAASRNDLNNLYPNSLLKTYKCYYFSESGNTFNNLGDLDPAGNQMGGDSENLNVGDPVGCADMQGGKNVQVGIRTGILNQFGNRNTMLGVDVGRSLNTGNNNLFLGYGAGNNYVSSNASLVGAYAGTKLSSANNQDIVMVGTGAGLNTTTASNVVVVGPQAAKATTTMNNSVTIGTRALTSAGTITDSLVAGSNTVTGTASSTRDIIIGTNSGNQLPGTTDNMIIGTNSSQRTTTMTRSVLIGNETGRNRLTIEESVMVGYGAGLANPGVLPNNIGPRNVLMGYYAGSNLSSGSDNFIAGARAGVALTEGSYNTLIGSSSDNSNSAGSRLTTGSYNFLVGTNTASSLTTGNKNIVLGSESANKLTTQSHNFVFGWGSGNELASSNNIIIGNESGQTVTDSGVLIIGHASGTNSQGADTLILGHNCARGLTGARNTIIGNYGAGATGAVVLSGTDNVLIGPYAGYQLTTGSFNVLIGGGTSSISTGRTLQSGSGNMLFGYQAAPFVQSGNHNLVFGRQAAYSLASGSQNIILGAEAGRTITSGSENVIIGNEAGKNISVGIGLVLIGNKAGYSSVGSSIVSDNLFIGNEVGYNVTNGSRSTMIGNQAGRAETIGNEHTYIGNKAGWYLNQAYRNICVGYFAGKGVSEVASQNSTDNIILGSYAGNLLTSGADNILIGSRAGSNVGPRVKNIMIGSHAGALSDASYNIFVGATTDDPLVSDKAVGYDAKGSFNVVMGINAGVDLTTGEKNVIMGFEAGEHVTSGSKNIMMGEGSGYKLTSGINNILLGQNAGVTTDHTTGGLVTGNNVIAIGTNAGSNLGASVQDAILIGTEAGYNTKVDNAICIGYNAGALNSTGAGGISIGYRAGSSSQAAEGCISIGSNAGAAFLGLSNIGQNISIGDEAASMNQGIRAITLGAEAMANTSNASNVIVIGFQAGSNIGQMPTVSGVRPDDSIIIGYRAAAGGDIGEDNILIGTQTGEHIDNPRVFTRNVMLGAGAGANSNLAVDSIVLGQAGLEGTGGVKNILMGSGAGTVLGNPLPITPIIWGNIVPGLNYTYLGMNYDQARLYFKEGDIILFEEPNKEYSYQVQLGGIVNTGEYYNSTTVANNSVTILVFTQPYPDTAETLPVGTTVRSLGYLDTQNVGLVDESKASGNSLVGESAGAEITTGSKSVAFGTGALAKNKIAKYNNAIGTESAYNAISDNNTCLGTRAGYSIDLYDGLTYNSNSVSFDSNTNTINYGGGFTVDTNEFSFGTVFDVSGSTLNDGRYTVFNANSSAVIINGVPRYQNVGVPLNVTANDLIINSSTFTFDSLSESGLGLAVGPYQFDPAFNRKAHIIKIDPNLSWNSLDNTNIFRITGSKYNDGVYYKSYDTVPTNNSYVVFGNFIPEIFDSNVIISTSSINSLDTITDGVSFNDYPINSPFYAFFGVNKGTYKMANLPAENLPIQSKYQLARPLSNTALVSSTVLNSINENNVIFTSGFQQTDEILPSSISSGNSSPSYNARYSFRKLQYIGSSVFTLYVSNTTLFGVPESLYKAVNEGCDYFRINMAGDNDNVLLKLYTTPLSYVLTFDIVRSTSVGPIDQLLVGSNTNPVYFTHSVLKNLSSDVSSTFSNLGIIQINSLYNMGLDNHTGSYVIDTVVDDNIILAGDQVMPLMASDLTGVVQQLPEYGYTVNFTSQLKTNIVNEFLSVDPSYLDSSNPKINGMDIMIQTGSFVPTSDPTFTYVINNTTKTITANKRYIFNKLVAPCVVELDGNYLLVVANDYPFNVLKIDPSQDLSSLTSFTNLPINFNTISSHSSSTRLDQLTPSVEYEIFGDDGNNKTLITPVAGAISQYSVYVTSTPALVNSNSNKTVLGLFSPSYNPYTGAGPMLYFSIKNSILPRGYFKRIYIPNANLSISNVSSNIATLVCNSPNSSVISNIDMIKKYDIIKIQGMNNSQNNGLFTITSNISQVGSNYTMTIEHKNMSSSLDESTVLNSNITINEFRTYIDEPNGLEPDINFQNLYTSYGNLAAFLRFAPCYRSNIDTAVGYLGTHVGNVNVMQNSLNFTVDGWNNSNVVSNVAVNLLETVPTYSKENSTLAGFPPDISNFLIAAGTPVPDFGGNTIVEMNNIHTPPIGYIHNYMYRDSTTFSTNLQSPKYIFSTDKYKMYTTGNNGIKGRITILSNIITIDAVDANSFGGAIDYNYGRRDNEFKDLINRPFAGIREGMLLNITDGSSYSANVMVSSITKGANGQLIQITNDTRFNPTLPNATWNFSTISPVVELTIQLLWAPGVITAQLISDRYNFAAVTSNSFISNYTNYTCSFLCKLPLTDVELKSFGNDFLYFNNYCIPGKSRKIITDTIAEDDTNIVKVLPYTFLFGTNNKWLIDDFGNRTQIIQKSLINNENPYTNILYFIYQSWSNVDFIVFDSGASLLVDVGYGIDFNVLEPGVILAITVNTITYYVQISTINTMNYLTLNLTYNPNVPLLDGSYTSAEFLVNIIGSRNTLTTNLEYFKPGQKVIVSKTSTTNDGVFLTSLSAPTAPECIFLESYYRTVDTASPEFGVIEKAMFGTEQYPISYPDGFTTTLTSPYNTFDIPLQANITTNFLTTFKSGDAVEITSASLNGTFTVPENPQLDLYILPLESLPSGLVEPGAVSLTKSIGFRIIGKAISTVTDAGVVKFHYTDAQGNNIMIGSFTGQFAGANGLSVHNLFLGNKVGQTNQGSGNVFFGSETGFATDASQGATTYDNKLAIYKNNFIGVPNNPLIGGDFASGRVGIGTIDPDGKLLSTLGSRTLMVVDGKVRAEAYNTFTGTHFVVFDKSQQPNFPEPGMILSSTGKVEKLGLLDNIVECNLSTKLMDKRVYGIYAGDEKIEGRMMAHCAAVGEGSILVCSIAGEVENGDYLCSSPVAGLAQLQPDDLLHSYTVAKVIEEVNWSAVSKYVIHEGVEYKVALVSCTYHCG